MCRTKSIANDDQNTVHTAHRCNIHKLESEQKKARSPAKTMFDFVTKKREHQQQPPPPQ